MQGIELSQTSSYITSSTFSIYTTIQKFVVGQIFLCFLKSLMLTKAAFIWLYAPYL